ncbi:MAG: monomethylamine:corrinoid methyltransferase [Chloroflexi bacterium]|nr:monomethylamine:corrinoid methyltransferase [Chloroflexota bacterium]MBU1746517.1 monomethylamine:corrinoid methyltransferase [Chloroflexota bacterium]
MNFKEVAKRAETGPLMEANDFLMRRVATPVMKLQKQYDIRWDGRTLVNLDDELADRCWAAGKELLLTAGMYSMNSRRVIEFAPVEVDYVLRFVRDRLPMGQGKDTVKIRHRGVEDPRRPFIFSGPFNADVHEDMFVRLNEAFAQERIIDCLFLPGYLKELDGQVIRPNSGLSSRAAVLYGQWAREATRRAGRPGIPICGHSVMALNEIACTNEDWGLRSTDPRAMVLISELQVDDVTLTRLAYYLAYGCPIYTAFTPLVGGYGGDPAGTAIVAVASFIGAIMLGAEICHIGPQHIKYKQQTNNHSLFMGSLANQAVARNSHIIATTSHTTAGRPGSEQYAYEFSALALAVVPSGSNVTGPRPAEPLGYNDVSPLMARLFGEVAHAAAGLTRAQATPIVESLYEKYKDKISFAEAPKGQPFEQLYDLETLTPTPEHQAVYDRVKEELIRLGVPLY